MFFNGALYEKVEIICNINIQDLDTYVLVSNNLSWHARHFQLKFKNKKENIHIQLQLLVQTLPLMMNFRGRLKPEHSRGVPSSKR